MDPQFVSTLAETATDLAEAGFGAFFGAWCAFRFERRQKSGEERATQAAGIRRALFTLAIQRSFLENFTRLYLAPHRRDDYRWRNLPTYLNIPIYEELDLSALSFLLELRAGDLLNQLAHGQNQFRTLLGVLDARNAEYQRLRERISYSVIAKQKLGFEVDSLMELTRALYEASTYSLEANKEDIEAIRSFLREKFPQEHVPEIRIQPAAGPGGTTANPGPQADG